MSREEQKTGEEIVCRLAKPKQKGLLPLIFSRFLIIAVLLALQILIIVGIYYRLYENVKLFRAGLTIFTFVMQVYLFTSDADASAKLTWLLIISIAPIPGALLLFHTQYNAGHRKIIQNEEALIRATKDAIPQPEGVLEKLGADGSDTDDLVRYLNRSGCFPAYENTKVQYFPLGEDKFAAMLEELKKAEQFIYLEYFIIEEGFMWGKVLEILLQKAAEGVDVRVMYDGMCEMSTLPVNYWKLLEARGIHAKPFSPIKPVLSSHYNYRDHRKILVIDGKTGFTGGVNLADEYINRVERFGHWKDTAVMLKGEAVKSLMLMFLQMWCIGEADPDLPDYLMETEPGSVSDEKSPGTSNRKESPEQKESSEQDESTEPEESPEQEPEDGYVIPYCDCPLDEDKVGEMVYMDMLNRAGDYVHVMTPYLILDGELETALKYAAQRGVDVKLILPGIPDKKIPYALAKSHYRALTAAGVQIFEYTPGFVHAKVVVSDDKKAVVGTINMDYRSLYHHFECAAYLYKTPCIQEIEEDFQKTLSVCRAVTPETIRNEKLYYKIVGSVMKFIAPLM